MSYHLYKMESDDIENSDSVAHLAMDNEERVGLRDAPQREQELSQVSVSITAGDSVPPSRSTSQSNGISPRKFQINDDDDEGDDLEGGTGGPPPKSLLAPVPSRDTPSNPRKSPSNAMKQIVTKKYSTEL